MAATATSSSLHHPQYYDTDEEQEERHLSALHGEAADDDDDSTSATSRKRNGPSQSTTLTEVDAAAAAEFEEKIRRKKARPVLTPAVLKGEKGILFVRRSFPASVPKYRDAPLNKAHGTGKLAQRLTAAGQIDAAARYSRGLVAAYRDFSEHLFPNLAPEDVFLKVEQLGAKQEVKDYLNIMREDVRREYVEGLLGKEKAGRILDELQYGMRAAMHPDMDRLKQRRDGVGVTSSLGRNEEHLEERTDTLRASTPKRVVVVNPYARTKEDVVALPASASLTAGGETTDALANTDLNAAEEEEEDEEELSVNGDVDEADNCATTTAAEDDNVAKEKEQAVKSATTEKQDGITEETNDDAAEEVDRDELRDDAERINKGAKETINVDADDTAEKKLPKTQETATNEEEAEVSPTIDNAKETHQSLSREHLSDEPTTQETLTLAASQLDAMEPDFSQASMTKEFTAFARPTQDAQEGKGGLFSQTQDNDQFSQMQETERFSQTQDGERFSQTQDDGKPIVFEEEGEDSVMPLVKNCGSGEQQLLGQTMDTQLSLEY